MQTLLVPRITLQDLQVYLGLEICGRPTGLFNSGFLLTETGELSMQVPPDSQAEKTIIALVFNSPQYEKSFW